MKCIIDFLNQNSGAIQAISTIVLVGVTIWYSIYTKRMANLMKDQITSKILIENQAVGSQLIEKRVSERSFDRNSFLSFNSLFDVRNEGNASGSIYKPRLELSIPTLGLCFKLDPKTKSYETYNHQSSGSMSSYETRTINHGSSIFLQGGGSDRIELEYQLNIDSDDKLHFVNEAKKNPDLVGYHFLTTDNLGKEYRIKVTDIKEERDFGIR